MAFTPAELEKIKQFKATQAANTASPEQPTVTKTTETVVEPAVPVEQPVEQTPAMPEVQPEQKSRFEQFQEFSKTKDTAEPVVPEPTQFERLQEREGQRQDRMLDMNNSVGSLLKVKPTDRETGNQNFINARKAMEAKVEKPTVLGGLKAVGNMLLDGIKNLSEGDVIGEAIASGLIEQHKLPALRRGERELREKLIENNPEKAEQIKNMPFNKLGVSYPNMWELGADIGLVALDLMFLGESKVVIAGVKKIGKEALKQGGKAGFKKFIAGVTKLGAKEWVKTGGIGAGFTGLQTIKEGADPTTAQGALDVTKSAGVGFGFGASLAIGLPLLLKGGMATVKGVQRKFTSRQTNLGNDIMDLWNKSVVPQFRGKKKTPAGIAKYKLDSATVIDDLTRNQDVIKITNEFGEIVDGNPQTLDQLSQGVQERKKQIFGEYDRIATEAGDDGLKVGLDRPFTAGTEQTTLRKELQTIVDSKMKKATRKKAQQALNELDELGEFSAKEAQDKLAELNGDLKSFYQNGGNSAIAKIDAMMANAFRTMMDEGISLLKGDKYSDLRKLYGAYKNVEADVVHRSLVEGRKPPKGFFDFSDILIARDIARGFAGDMTGFASAAAQGGTKKWLKFMNDKNRMVKTMFGHADELLEIQTKKASRLPKADLGTDFTKQAKIRANKAGILNPAEIKKLKARPKSEVAMGIVRDQTLSAEDLLVQDASIRKYMKNKDQLVRDYVEKFGKKVNTDDARILFEDVGYVGTNSPAVHEAASKLAKDVWALGLKNEGDIARFYAGGSGSGKSTGVRSIGQTLDNVATVLDSNLNDYKKARAKFDIARKAGKTPEVTYVYRDPIESYENGVIKRMLGNKEKGRVIPIDIHVNTHQGALDTLKQLQKDGDVELILIDNTRGAKDVKIMPQEQLRTLEMPKDFKQTLIDKTKKLLKDGKITEAQYKSIMGKNV